MRVYGWRSARDTFQDSQDLSLKGGLHLAQVAEVPMAETLMEGREDPFCQGRTDVGGNQRSEERRVGKECRL